MFGGQFRAEAGSGGDALTDRRRKRELFDGRHAVVGEQLPVLARNTVRDSPGSNPLLKGHLIGINAPLNEADDGMGAAGVGKNLGVASHGRTLGFLLFRVNRTSVEPGCSAVDMTPGERLRQKRQERGLSAEDLASRVGRSVSAVRNQENGTNGIPAPLARKYAAALGTTPGWLLYGHDAPEVSASPEVSELPIIGPVQAGAWLAIDESAQDDPIFFAALADRRYPHARQWLREVRGDSMNAKGIMPGDLVHIVDLGEAGINLNSGMIVEVTRTRAGGQLKEITLKEVEISADGIRLWPRSTNPRWSAPLVLDDGAGDDIEVRVTGLLLQAIKRFL